MIRAIKERVTVNPGGTIEVRCPDLAPGTSAEVIIMVEETPGELPPLTSYFGKGRGCFASAEEVENYLRAEREAWER